MATIAKQFLAKNGLDNNNAVIINVAAPVNATDASNKAFSSNASNLASGTVPAARLGTGAPDNSTYLQGDGKWNLKFIENTIVNAATTGSVALDLKYSVFNLSLIGTTTLALQQIPTFGANDTLSIVIRISQGGVAYTLSWFSGITWLTPGGTAPTLPSANNSAEYVLSTTNGVNWVGRKGAAN